MISSYPLHTVRRYKFNHLAMISTTAVAGKAGFTLDSATTAVVEFMAKWIIRSIFNGLPSLSFFFRFSLLMLCICWMVRDC